MTWGYGGKMGSLANLDRTEDRGAQLCKGGTYGL